METDVKRLFERYEALFNRCLSGDVDMDAVGSLYASEFIGAAPAGVRTGKNDEQFKEALKQGYAHYRALGTKEMRTRSLRITPLDDRHCVAHVCWTAVYAPKHQSEVEIDFDVHYFIHKLEGEPKVFGWVSGDEQALLKKHGIA